MVFRTIGFTNVNREEQPSIHGLLESRLENKTTANTSHKTDYSPSQSKNRNRMNLSGAKVLVTGGSLGIGKATAELLIQKGASVLITGRSLERLEKAAQEIGASYVVADVSTQKGIDDTMAAVHSELGGLDVLVNNAGIGRFPELSEVEWEDFQVVFNTNVFGAAMMAKACAEIFKAQSSGNIVNIASTAGKKGFARGSVYSASKFALRSMTECWQAELRKHNVRVFGVNPSEVTTAFAQEERIERPEVDNKLRSQEIAHAIVSGLEMDNRGFIPELTVFATNPWSE